MMVPEKYEKKLNSVRNKICEIYPETRWYALKIERDRYSFAFIQNNMNEDGYETYLEVTQEEFMDASEEQLVRMCIRNAVMKRI